MQRDERRESQRWAELGWEKSRVCEYDKRPLQLIPCGENKPILKQHFAPSRDANPTPYNANSALIATCGFLNETTITGPLQWRPAFCRGHVESTWGAKLQVCGDKGPPRPQ